MVNKDKVSAQYSEINSNRTDEIAKSPPSNLPGRGDLVLFFSFDIANSSRLKTVDYADWPKVIKGVFNEVQAMITSRSDKIGVVEFWRLLGDEIVFIKKVKTLQDLWDSVECISEILELMVTGLSSGSFFSKWFKSEPNKANAMHLYNIISLKACAWVSVIYDVSKKTDYPTHPFGNIEVKFDGLKGHWVMEFLGNDVDAGFRLAKQVCPGHMVVCFELAFLLYHYAKEYLSHITDRLHVITYQQLKGIWDDNPYPIIWYNVHGKELSSNFTIGNYSELLIKQYLDIKNKVCVGDQSQLPFGLPLEMFEIEEIFFEKLITDRHLSKKLSHIEEILNQKPLTEKRLLDAYEKMELHCAVACYSDTDELPKVLIVKRADNKDYKPSKWEFGCAKASSRQELVDKIKDEYKEDFGVEITLITDGDRTQDQQPVPLAIYSIERDMETHYGILMTARIDNPEHFKLNKSKYSDYKWLARDDYINFEEPAVFDFKNSLCKVFEFIESRGH